MTVPEILLTFGGVLHLTILVASAQIPRVLNWQKELAGLHPFLRQLFWVYGVFVVMTIIGFGTISLLCKQDLLSGSLLARSFCGFVAVFWLTRLVVQFFVFDARPFLTNWYYKCGYHALTIGFVVLSAIYGWLCFRP